MIFSLKIDSRNAAMCGGGMAEVERLLYQVAQAVERQETGGGLLDINGQKCGDWDMDDERPDLANCEAEELVQFADDYAITLDDDPRKLSRAELIEGLESIAVACYDDESDEILAAAYGDSMLAGDLPGDCSGWRDVCAEEWGA
jgi:hypothetical protein